MESPGMFVFKWPISAPRNAHIFLHQPPISIHGCPGLLFILLSPVDFHSYLSSVFLMEGLQIFGILIRNAPSVPLIIRGSPSEVLVFFPRGMMLSVQIITFDACSFFYGALTFQLSSSSKRNWVWENGHLFYSESITLAKNQ